VAALAARQLDPLLPAMKAHGVPALIRHLRGEITLDAAAAIGRADTRHYAKRQFTWFRHQLPEFEWVRPERHGDGFMSRDCEEGSRPVIPGRCQRVRAKRGPMTGSASNPEARDSGFALTRAPE